MAILIKNGNVIQGLENAQPGDVLIEGGTIRCIAASIEPDSADTEIDATGCYVAPGYIDLHIHGVGEHLVDKGPADLRAIRRLLPRYGVTGYLPTVLPLPPGEDTELISTLAGSADAGGGSQTLGFFLEGPFLALPGALPEEALGKPTAGRVESLQQAAAPFPAVFAASPDLEGVIELIPLMAKGGTPVFITHTAATVAQTQAGIAAGISHATHFYDVFPSPPVADPGVRSSGAVEAILADPSVTVDFILDGEHVDPVAVQAALAAKGPEGVCLVTDANLGAGLHPGRYKGLNDREIDFAYPGAPARLVDEQGNPGSLAGSGLTMDRAVQNACSMLAASVPRAVAMASTNPARVLGLEKSKGRIAEGFDADLIILDADLSVIRTFVAGREVFSR